MGSMLFIGMHPIFTFPAGYVIDKYGVDYSLKIGGLL
jgi:hypothetical protein